MGQVPHHSQLLVIGSGRWASHLCHYLSLLQLSPLQWSRHDSPEELICKLSKVDRVALAISDDAIDSFYLGWKDHFANKMIFHCSGALNHPVLASAHPLMSFGRTFYDLDVYQKMVFVTEQERAHLKELLPELNNANFTIKSLDKAFYHALCVVSGNFTTLLWRQVFDEATRLNIPSSAFVPYLEQICENLKIDFKQALTGPLVRGDRQTIKKNLASLEGSPLKKIYEAFLIGFAQLDPSQGVLL